MFITFYHNDKTVCVQADQVVPSVSTNKILYHKWDKDGSGSILNVNVIGINDNNSFNIDELREIVNQ